MKVSVRRLLQSRWPIASAVVAVVAILVAAYAVSRLRGGQHWKAVWVENFDGAEGARPSPQNWLSDIGTSYPGGAAQWGTGEAETYIDDPANVSLDGRGDLKITATRDASGAWQSGRLETRRTDFQPPAGGELKVEARIKTPDGGQGYWPAFWMLGQDFRGNYTNWPGVGEVDVMENIGREHSIVHGTLHCGTAPGGPCYENNGIGGSYTLPDGRAFSAGFHTFAVEWDRSRPEEEIRWYVDGRRYFTIHPSDVGATTWSEATHHGFFLVLNLAIGGTWPGSPDASTRPNASMVVDYVSVSRK
jgi:beta-glucanase (GH16 family)